MSAPERTRGSGAGLGQGAALHATTGDEAEVVPDVVLDKQVHVVHGDAADTIHERESSVGHHDRF